MVLYLMDALHICGVEKYSICRECKGKHTDQDRPDGENLRICYDPSVILGDMTT